ncbi:hypothetical protein [Streptomyces poriticola]
MRTFPLGGAAEAHALGERGRTTGKLVLVVDRGPGRSGRATDAVRRRRDR